MAVANPLITILKFLGMALIFLISAQTKLPVIVFVGFVWLCWAWSNTLSWLRHIFAILGLALIVFGWVEYDKMLSLMRGIEGSHNSTSGHHWAAMMATSGKISLMLTAVGIILMSCADFRKSGHMSEVHAENTGDPNTEGQVWPPTPRRPI